MTGRTDWLPPLITLADHGGDWDCFDQAVYDAFRADWVHSRPTLLGKRMGLKAHPLQANKEATYYHITHEGTDENTRQPDLRRMERVCWPRAMIEAIGTDKVLVWRIQRTTKGGQQDRLLLALPDFSYIVVVEDRGEYALLWTAYTVEYENRRERLRREYEAHK